MSYHRDDRMWGPPPGSGSWRGEGPRGREGPLSDRGGGGGGGGGNSWGGPQRDMERRGGQDNRQPPPPPPGNLLAGRLQAPPPIEPPFVVDRETTCPLLIRVFCKPGSHHRLEEFAVRGKEPGADEIQIYTWKDASLRELCDLIKEIKPQARSGSARFSFSFVYPDRRGKNVMKNVGVVHSTRFGEDETKTLKSLSFQTGDFLDVAMLL